MQEKTIIVISRTNFELFKGLNQKDLSGNNPAEHNRLNIRPLWTSELDEEGKIQRFTFKAGENECPEYIVEWYSFKKLCDNGTLTIKGSYSSNREKVKDTNLAELRKLEEQLKALKKENEELKKQNNREVKTTTIEEA